ncbi:MAG: hypothetical protein AUG48_04635 [Actinobacteria bacterium 13_1_20CM_3_68_9]|nr:MAG: hypothetical protein AUG48_04635 [Actinobacteria bacterium 13_1_20CM_3_68_9]
MTRRRRLALVATTVLAACALAAALLATRSSDGASVMRTTQPAAVRAALSTRLEQSHLNYRWVVCVRTGRIFRNHHVVRCNVNFGDPHIVAYCSIIDGGRLITNHETPSFSCPADLQGWSTKTVTGP